MPACEGNSVVKKRQAQNATIRLAVLDNGVLRIDSVKNRTVIKKIGKIYTSGAPSVTYAAT